MLQKHQFSSAATEKEFPEATEKECPLVSSGLTLHTVVEEKGYEAIAEMGWWQGRKQ